MEKHLQPTKAQLKVLMRLRVGGDYSAYEAGASVTTMDALTKKGYLECKDRTPAGHIFSARTAIRFTRIK